MLNAAMVFVWKMFIAVARCQHKSVKNVSRALTTIKPLWNLLLLSRDSVCLTACEPQSPCEQERKGKKNFFVFFDCDFYHQDAFTTYLIDREGGKIFCAMLLCNLIIICVRFSPKENQWERVSDGTKFISNISEFTESAKINWKYPDRCVEAEISRKNQNTAVPSYLFC